MLVGPTSKGRKGTAEYQIRNLFQIADQEWELNNISSRISTGEGMLDQIRDASEPKLDRKTREMVVEDPGVTDKRLMFSISEFGFVFDAMIRPGNTASATLRELWNCPKVIKPGTKTNKTKVTEPHVSVMGHMTITELRTKLDSTSVSNGFGNRFLYVLSRRIHALPFGGQFDDKTAAELGEIALNLKDALALAKSRGQMFRTPDANKAWARLYRRITRDQPGLFGDLVGRAEPQVLRLALIYALLDRSDMIECCHLKAADAVRQYSEASTQFIFGDSLGNPLADQILRLLRHAGKRGMNRRELYAGLGNNPQKEKLSEALGLLATCGKATCVVLPGSGTGASSWVERWFAT
jgi:hypothetical protein